MIKSTGSTVLRRNAIAAAIFGGFVAPAALAANPGDPLGAPFTVNTTQSRVAFPPALARSGKSGDFVVVWQSQATGSQTINVRARRFKSDGTPQGNDFQVNVLALGSRVNPAVAMDDDGDFVVAWANPTPASIYARRYSASGLPGLPLLIGGGSQWVGVPAVAMDPDGDFVVAWTESSGLSLPVGTATGCYYDQPPCFGVALQSSTLHALRYSAGGLPLGSASLVDSATWATFHSAKGGTTPILPPGQYPPDVELNNFPHVAMAADGGFVVAWSRPQATGNFFDTYVRQYSSHNQAAAATLVSSTDDVALNPVIAADHAGDFVISYSRVLSASTQGIFERRYNANGAANGGELRVDDGSHPLPRYPVVSMDASGNFVVAWEQGSYDSNGYAALGQRFAAAGGTLGGNFRLNSVGDTAWWPQIASDASGDFVSAWYDCCGSVIQARLFSGP